MYFYCFQSTKVSDQTDLNKSTNPLIFSGFQSGSPEEIIKKLPRNSTPICKDVINDKSSNDCNGMIINSGLYLFNHIKCI